MFDQRYIDNLPNEVIECMLAHLPLSLLYEVRQSLVRDITSVNSRIAHTWIQKSPSIATVDHAIFACITTNSAQERYLLSMPPPNTFLSAFSTSDAAANASSSFPAPPPKPTHCIAIRLGHRVDDYNMPLHTMLFPANILQSENAISFKPPHASIDESKVTGSPRVQIPCRESDLRHFRISFQGWQHKNYALDLMAAEARERGKFPAIHDTDNPQSKQKDMNAVANIIWKQSFTEVSERQFRIDANEDNVALNDQGKTYITGFPDCLLKYRLSKKPSLPLDVAQGASSETLRQAEEERWHQQRSMPMESLLYLEPVECIVTVDWIRRGGLIRRKVLVEDQDAPSMVQQLSLHPDEIESSAYDNERAGDHLFPDRIRHVKEYLIKHNSTYCLDDIWELPGLVDYVASQDSQERLDTILAPYITRSIEVCPDAGYTPTNRLLVSACLRKRSLDPSLMWKFSFSRRFMEHPVPGARRICSPPEENNEVSPTPSTLSQASASYERFMPGKGGKGPQDALCVKLPGGWTISDDVRRTVDRIEGAEFMQRLVLNGLRESELGISDPESTLAAMGAMDPAAWVTSAAGVMSRWWNGNGTSTAPLSGTPMEGA